ncbi:MAG: type II secretion system F family protein [Acidobacteriaceae bacterium]
MLLITIAIGLTIFIALALLALLINRRSAVEARLDDVIAGYGTSRRSFSQRVTLLLEWSGNAANRVRRSVGLGDSPSVVRKLGLAGYRKPEQAELYYAARLLLPVTAALATSFLIKENSFFWVVAATATAYFLPEFWLTGAIKRRREAIRLALPDALDLLVICMEAGLGLDQALIRVGEELRITHAAISDEFLLINREQRAGVPRIDAWRHMADRTQLEVVRSFVSMLVQTDRFGTPVSKSLGTFADSLRTRRRQLAEEMAAKTTIKMVFPLVLFIFPSMFIVLLAPAIISIQHNMGNLFQ